MAKACTFIGNRDLSLNEQWALRPRLQQAILNYLNAGGYFFACGGSYGFDLVAAEEVLNFKQYYPYIQMILLLPYPHYTSIIPQGGRWKTSNAYNRLCNTVFIVILILLIEKASIQSVISSLLMVVIIVFTIRIPRLRLIRNPS